MKIIEYSSQHHFVYFQVYGKVSYSEVTHILTDVIRKFGGCESIKILADYRFVVIDELHIDKIRSIAKMVNTEFAIHFRYVRWANLSREPIQTVGSVIFSGLIEQNFIDYHQFTTPHGAIKWLQIPDECIQRMDSKNILFKDGNDRLILYVK